MRPNLNTHKKRHGTFMYPGSTGFKFNFGPRKFTMANSARVANAVIVAIILFMGIVTFNPIIAGVIAALFLAYAYSGKAERNAFATGAPGGEPTAEEKAAMAKIEAKIAEIYEVKSKADKDLIVELKRQLDEIKAPELKTEVARLAAELKAISEKAKPTDKSISFKAALTEALHEKKEEIDLILKSNGKMKGPLMLEVKAAVTVEMLNTIEAAGSASHFSLTSNTGIISKLRKRIMTYLESVAIGGLAIERPYAMWIEELDEQGTPFFIGEGDSKTQLSVRYEEREKKARKIAVYGKVTTEMLRYLPQLISYIQNNLMRRMDIKTEDQLFNGDDTGDNLAGLIPYATAFDGGVGVAGGSGLVGLVPNANAYDVIRAAALQVFNSYGVATRMFILPDILAQMEVAKDSEDRYLLPPFSTQGGKIVAGIELVPTNALNGTGYDFVGGDLTVINVSFLEQANIQIGLDGNDFTQNKKTILMEQQLVQFVSANDTQVIVKGDMATAKALLEATPIP